MTWSGSGVADVPVLLAGECCVLTVSESVAGGGYGGEELDFIWCGKAADPGLLQVKVRTDVFIDVCDLPGSPLLPLPISQNLLLHPSRMFAFGSMASPDIESGSSA